MAIMTAEIASRRMHEVSPEWRERVNEFANFIEEVGASPYPIEQHLHAGVYSRTGCQKAGMVCATALVKVPTQLIVSGHCRIYCERDVFEIHGYRVLEGLPGRQMIVYTYEDTWATVMFATNARTVDEAEAEAVGEEVVGRLMNHRGNPCSDLLAQQPPR